MEITKLGATAENLNRAGDNSLYNRYNQMVLYNSQWGRILAYSNNIGTVMTLDVSNAWVYNGNAAGSYKILCYDREIFVVPIYKWYLCPKFRVVYNANTLTSPTYVDLYVNVVNSDMISFKREINTLSTGVDCFMLQENAEIPEGYTAKEYNTGASLADYISANTPPP